MIHPELLEILCCPETHQPVREAAPELLERVNHAVRAGGVKAEGGAEVNEAVAGGLVREDGKFLYPIRNGIPIMLVEERIAIPDGAPPVSGDDVQDDSEAGHHQMKPDAGS